MNDNRTDLELVLPKAEGVAEIAPHSRPLARWFWIFHPPAPAPLIESPTEIAQSYRRWRTQVLATTMFGYAVYYILRKNISVAMPAMESDLGISKADLGLFLTLHGVLYGISKFFNGFLGDQANAATFMSFGLVCSAVVNALFGFSTAAVTLGFFWLINGYVQGMGFPPCARVITHWFSPKERATKFSIWNTSHSIGAAVALILTGYLVVYDWRLCFWVPAAIGAIGALVILTFLRDTPRSMGLPEIEEYTGERVTVTNARHEHTENFVVFLRRHVLTNPLIWTLSLANFFVYVVRYSILDWGPSFLKESRGVELAHTGWLVACFEIGGVVGMLVGGVMTDRIFRSHAGRACVVYMTACTALIYAFWTYAEDSTVLNSVALAGIGFFIYGPQCLVGVIAANLGTKRAAATAIGLTGLFGYFSTVLSGWGLGALVDRFGWHHGFQIVMGSALAACLLFLTVWKVNADTELNAHV